MDDWFEPGRRQKTTEQTNASKERKKKRKRWIGNLDVARVRIRIKMVSLVAAVFGSNQINFFFFYSNRVEKRDSNLIYLIRFVHFVARKRDEMNEHRFYQMKMNLVRFLALICQKMSKNEFCSFFGFKIAGKRVKNNF